MISELINKVFGGGRYKKYFVLGAVVLIALTVLNLATRESFEQRWLVDTDLNANKNFGDLIGSEVHAYSGLAFYKINVESGDLTILRSGLKLPTPNALYWADSEGAMLNFSGSFWRSRVHDALQSNGQGLSRVTRDYTWYVDFASGTLSLVNELPVNHGLAVFSTDDRGFYYIPDHSRPGHHFDHDDTPADTISLHFYDISTKQDEAVLKNLDVTDLSYLGKCNDTTQKICFIARDKANLGTENLYAVNDDKQVSKIVEVDGRLLPTSDPELFIAAAEEEGRGAESQHEQIDHTESAAHLRNIRDSSVTPLGFLIGGSDITTHFMPANVFYVLDSSLFSTPSSRQASMYRAGKISADGKVQTELLPLIYSGGRAFEGGVLGNISRGNSGHALLTTFDGGQIIFTDQESTGDISKVDPQSAQSDVNKCAGITAQDSQFFEEESLFKVFFNESAGLNASIKSFSDCVINSNSALLIGYNYYFGTLDPDSGRITSD